MTIYHRQTSLPHPANLLHQVNKQTVNLKATNIAATSPKHATTDFRGTQKRPEKRRTPCVSGDLANRSERISMKLLFRGKTWCSNEAKRSRDLSFNSSSAFICSCKFSIEQNSESTYSLQNPLTFADFAYFCGIHNTRNVPTKFTLHSCVRRIHGNFVSGIHLDFGTKLKISFLKSRNIQTQKLSAYRVHSLTS